MMIKKIPIWKLAGENVFTSQKINKFIGVADIPGIKCKHEKNSSRNYEIPDTV